jgi:hypothetical protein
MYVLHQLSPLPGYQASRNLQGNTGQGRSTQVYRVLQVSNQEGPWEAHGSSTWDRWLDHGTAPGSPNQGDRSSYKVSYNMADFRSALLTSHTLNLTEVNLAVG